MAPLSSSVGAPSPDGFVWSATELTMPYFGPRLSPLGIVTQPGGEAQLAMPDGGTVFVRDALCSAARRGDLDALMHYGQLHPPSLSARHNGATLVQVAAISNRGPVLQWLLNVHPDKFDEALVTRAREADSVVVPILIKLAQDHKKLRQRILFLAAHKGVPMLVRGIVVGLRCSPDFVANRITPLQAGARAGHVDVVAEIMRHVRCVNHAEMSGINAADSNRTNFPLVDAVTHNQPAVVRLLVNNGARAHGFTWEQRAAGEVRHHTLLAVAAQSGHPDLVAAVLEAGADVHHGGRVTRAGLVYGRPSPLVDAMTRGHYKVASLLLAKGANALDLLGAPPLPAWRHARAELRAAHQAAQRSCNTFLPAALSKRVRDERARAQAELSAAYRRLVKAICELATPPTEPSEDVRDSS